MNEEMDERISRVRKSTRDVAMCREYAKYAMQALIATGKMPHDHDDKRELLAIRAWEIASVMARIDDAIKHSR